MECFCCLLLQECTITPLELMGKAVNFLPNVTSAHGKRSSVALRSDTIKPTDSYRAAPPFRQEIRSNRVPKSGLNSLASLLPKFNPISRNAVTQSSNLIIFTESI